MTRAAAYHELLPAVDRDAAIDDRTWRDLDLDDVFISLDRTASEPGRQWLYHALRTPRMVREPLTHLERLVQRIAGDGDITERLVNALSRLADPRAGQLAHLVLGELPRRPRFWWLFPALSASSVTCLALIAVWPRSLIVWIAICVVNVGVQIVYKPRVKRFVPALHELPGFIRAAQTIGELDIGESSQEMRDLREGARQLGMLRRATWWLMFEPGETNDLAASIYEYVNMLFLLDVNAFVFALVSLRVSQPVMRRMFEAIGFLDTAQSVARWRTELPRWSSPEFTEPWKSLTTESLFHPLLAKPVANSLDVQDAGVLITGSNMSGKTTFVRALGVNAVLAQTLHTVCAASWRAPMLRVRTSIERTDSVLEGKSYYLAEVEAVRGLIRAKRADAQHLFLLDEIFRGTNTAERVAGAYAVLAYLNRGLDLVVVATHDVELLHLLGDAYTPVHFREQISDGELTFDYRIHAGPSSTRNAIALLSLMEFPDAVVRDALAAMETR